MLERLEWDNHCLSKQAGIACERPGCVQSYPKCQAYLFLAFIGYNSLLGLFQP